MEKGQETGLSRTAEVREPNEKRSLGASMGENYGASGIFTTALPSALCAGMKEALHIMRHESCHRERLWENAEYFHHRLESLGLLVSPLESPIITVRIGPVARMMRVSEALFDAGLKCGSVCFPAIGKNDSLLRFTMNARHSRPQLDDAIDKLRSVCERFELLGRSEEQIRSHIG